RCFSLQHWSFVVGDCDDTTDLADLQFEIQGAIGLDRNDDVFRGGGFEALRFHRHFIRIRLEFGYREVPGVGSCDLASFGGVDVGGGNFGVGYAGAVRVCDAAG